MNIYRTLLSSCHLRQARLRPSGGMTNLLIVDNRFTFDLNQSAASKDSTAFNSYLLKSARTIIN